MTKNRCKLQAQASSYGAQNSSVYVCLSISDPGISYFTFSPSEAYQQNTITGKV